MAPKVIGIDPSLNGTGFCNTDGYAWSRVFRNRKNDPKGDQRLVVIRNELSNLLQQHLVPARTQSGHMVGIDLCIIESLPPYASGSASLGLVHGVIRCTLAAYGVRVAQVAPSALKKWSTGNGKATKEDMRAQAISDGLIAPEGSGLDDNAIDAAWLRAMGIHWLTGTVDMDGIIKELS